MEPRLASPRLAARTTCVLILSMVAIIQPTLADTKPTPQPATKLARPSLIPRGTPTTRSLSWEIASETAVANACDAQVTGIKSAKKRAEALAACKSGTKSSGGVQAASITYDPSSDNCVDASKVLCANAETMRLAPSYIFSVSATTPLVVKTENLTGINGSLPDTVLYLVKCDDSTCTAGGVVGIDDDDNFDTSNSLDSKIVLGSPASGYYVAYVVAWNAGRLGLADIVVSQAGGVDSTRTAQVFSRWSISSKELRTNDVLVVGQNPESPGMTTAGYENYHDSRLLAVTWSGNNCSSNCGRMQGQDDTVFSSGTESTTRLTRMTVGSALGSPTNATIFVGVYDNGSVGGTPEYYKMNARLAHIRRSSANGGSWSGSTNFDDVDGDGLTREVEAQLGTCDKYSDNNGSDVLVDGLDCSGVQLFVNQSIDAIPPTITPSCVSNPAQDRCWGPKDSDHDGIEDGAEFFVAAVGCDSAPAGPYREASGCARPNPILSTCDAGDWCQVEPNSSTPLSSPYNGQDPTVYDVFIQADRFTTADGSIEAADAHTLSSSQQAELREMWAVEPEQCWDGSSTGTCPHINDRRYRVNIHAFNAAGCQVQDDRVERELIKGGEDAGAIFARSHFFARANDTLRQYGVLRFAFALHQNGNGWSDWSRSFQWGNRDQVVGQVRSALSHEAGHSFGLAHRHRDTNDHVATCAGNTLCSWCQYDGADCTPVLPDNGCSPPGAQFDVEESPLPTVMSYQYGGGMMPKQPEPPTSTTFSSVCSITNLRFSKGLLERNLRETELDNSWAPGNGWAEWQLRYLAQMMFCYKSLRECRPASTFGLFSSYGLQFGPYCNTDGNGEATMCFFNWNGQNAHPTDTATSLGDTDITAGRWDDIPSTDSNEDVLEDINEWQRMLAVGRDFAKRDPGKGMCLYATTFNGPKVDDDYCGWEESITVDGGMTAADVNYPMGGCRTGADCVQGSATCRLDPASCSSGSDCKSGNCVSGHCGCTTDTECFSGQCIAGSCMTGWGACSCASDTDCPGQTPAYGACDSAIYYCITRRLGANVLPQDGGQPYPLRASAEFDGTDDRIQVHGGSNSRLEGLSGSYENAFTLHFDFRFDGFEGNETTHVLWRSGAFQATVVGGSGALQVQVTVGGHGALIWPGLKQGHWYRAIWSASTTGSGHFLWMRELDPKTGWYEDAGTGANGACRWQTWSSSLPPPGDLWAGHDGGSDSSLYFHGRLDNVALVNFVPTAKPVDCTQQQ